MNILISIIQLLAGLSILVILHEMGHFIFARLFNTRVEKFYLFFNPWFSIFKFKKGDTVYGLGWLPLGGYVKISGMIDESMDKEAMKEPPKPYEFRSKPAWQRLLIMIGGVLVNLLLGVLIFWMMKFAYGDIRLPNDNMHGGIWVDSLGYNVGFRNGDKIVEVDGEKVKYFEDARAEISLGYEKEVVVNRNDSLVKLVMPKGLVGKLSDRRSFLMTFRIPFVVKTVPDSSINYNAGLKENDRIVAVNGQSTRYFDEVVDVLQENSGKEIVVEVESSNQKRTVPLKVSDEGFIEVIRASFANKHLM
ncbi:MAG: site-2 protease family protein [Bacteroidales bacterium]|nr:site-2 protease family protein [Bacteroidales bacterium]